MMDYDGLWWYMDVYCGILWVCWEKHRRWNTRWGFRKRVSGGLPTSMSHEQAHEIWPQVMFSLGTRELANDLGTSFWKNMGFPRKKYTGPGCWSWFSRWNFCRTGTINTPIDRKWKNMMNTQINKNGSQGRSKWFLLHDVIQYSGVNLFYIFWRLCLLCVWWNGLWSQGVVSWGGSHRSQELSGYPPNWLPFRSHPRVFRRFPTNLSQ